MSFPVKVMDEKGGHAMGWLFSLISMPRRSQERDEAIAAAREVSGMDELRLASLWANIISTKPCAEGALIEVGCGRGGSGLVICKARTFAGIKEDVILVDTFRGIVNSGPLDKHKDGEMADATSEETSSFIASHEENAVVVKAVFPTTFNNERKYRFAHIDVDTHLSMSESLRYLIPAMVPGGIIVVDDYGVDSCPGVTKAVDDMAGDTRVRWAFTSTNQAVVVVL